MRYQGMTSISVGIISVDRIATKTSCRPGNLNLARVYAARLSKNTQDRVTIVAMITEFRNQWPKRPSDRILT
jgi:hypothetical protein